MALPAPWLSYKTQDGKEYYYNPQTKVTTWTRPLGDSSSSKKTQPEQEKRKASSSPAVGAGRGGLLAQIQQGTSLKKVKTVEKKLFASPPSGSSGRAVETGSGAASLAASGGGGMGSITAAIKSAGNLRKTPSSGIPRENGSGGGNSSNGAGGFAEIMRKNREAAARRSGSSSAPLTPRQTSSVSSSGSYENGNNSVESRLAAIECKLDKIMAHLGIN